MTTADVAQPVAASDEPTFLERTVDRMNPILVREIQQALSGRAFQAMLALSTFAVVALGLVFAWYGSSGEVHGRGSFVACVSCLAPLVLFLLPMQAFASMRQEVAGGGADQLALTRLGPLRIVTGKIAAGFVQFLVFLAVFAPVMAMTFLLRGVDVPTIALVLLFATLSSLAANSLCIALAPIGSARPVQQLLQGLTAAGLMVATFSCIVGSDDIVSGITWLLRGTDGSKVFLTIVLWYVVGITLCAIIGTTALSHPHENRSTPFRVFAVVAVPLFVAWLWFLVSGPGALGSALPMLAMMLALFLSPLWLWAVCEDAPMSPRVRTLVPTSSLWVLSVPFLPGGQRGVLFTWVLAALSLGFVVLATSHFRSSSYIDFDRAVVSWCYVVIFAAIGRGIRSRLGPGSRRSVLAFVLTVVVVALGSLLPLGIELVFTSRISGDWSAIHVLNPFFTIERMNHVRGVVAPLVAAAGLAMLACVPGVIAGTREVAQAASERRRRARAV